MPQEFNVLRCFKCDTFQIHIVKKVNKWCCKICHEKQSIKHVYGKGNGKECRLHVQKLNTLRMEKDIRKEQIVVSTMLSDAGVDSIDSDNAESYISKNNDLKPDILSKWSKFIELEETCLDNSNLDEDREEETLNGCRVVLENIKMKKKRNLKPTFKCSAKKPKLGNTNELKIDNDRKENLFEWNQKDTMDNTFNLSREKSSLVENQDGNNQQKLQVNNNVDKKSKWSNFIPDLVVENDEDVTNEYPLSSQRAMAMGNKTTRPFQQIFNRPDDDMNKNSKWSKYTPGMNSDIMLHDGDTLLSSFCNVELYDQNSDQSSNLTNNCEQLKPTLNVNPRRNIFMNDETLDDLDDILQI